MERGIPNRTTSRYTREAEENWSATFAYLAKVSTPFPGYLRKVHKVRRKNVKKIKLGEHSKLTASISERERIQKKIAGEIRKKLSWER